MSNHKVSQPPNVKVTLFPHQLTSIYNMEQMESHNDIVSDDTIKNTKIGINADITGYGKTLAMIGLIARNKMEWDLDIPYVFETITTEAKGRIKNYKITRFDKLKTTLVLVSNNIIGQWCQELSKTELTYIGLSSRKEIDDFEANLYDVVLVIPSLYNRLMHMYSKFAWKRFIFDEPGNLKIPPMEEIHAGFYWFVTATPYAIYSRYKNRNHKGGFMKDLFAVTNDFDSLCSDIIIQNNPSFVQESFIMPETIHIHHQCFQPIYNVVYNFVSSTISTMISAGNIEGAVLALGGTKTSNIVDVIKLNKHKELLNIDIKINYLHQINNTNPAIIELQTKRQSIMNQINDINERFQNILNDNCNICYEELTDPILEPNCHNLFCGKCLFKWLQRKPSCPLCRNEINPKDLVYIEKKSSPDNKSFTQKNRTTKIQKTIDLIKSNIKGKFLIYSEQNNTFSNLQLALLENNIDFVQMKGNVKMREKNLDLFKSGSIPVIFLNSNTDSAGINLTESTDIILYHHMPDFITNQIIGRANRIGRTIPLYVHHLNIQN